MILESKTPTKKRLRVVAAVITNGNKIFCAQRAYGFLKGKWEFPGGKIEQGETPEQALIREIKEELDTTITIDGFFMNVVYEYPEFILDMDVFKSHVKEGRLEIEKGIHSAEAWLDVASLQEEDWCPADQTIVKHIKEFASPLN
jgi:8-oxo-dGTP diphosphatase